MTRLTPAQLSVLYNWPLYAIGLVWLYYRWQGRAGLNCWRILLDTTVVVIAASRFLGPLIPSSGHALFLTYIGLTVDRRLFRVLAAILLLATIALKLSWGDYRSWLYGLLLGAALGIIYQRAGANVELAKSGGLR